MNSPEPSLFNGASLNFDGPIKSSRVGFNEQEEAEAAAEEQRRKNQLENEMVNAFDDMIDEADVYDEFDVSTDPSFHPDQLPTSTPFLVSSSGADTRPLREELIDSITVQPMRMSSDETHSFLVPEETLKGATEFIESGIVSASGQADLVPRFNTGYLDADVSKSESPYLSPEFVSQSSEHTMNNHINTAPLNFPVDNVTLQERLPADVLGTFDQVSVQDKIYDDRCSASASEPGDGFTSAQLKILCEARGREIEHLRHKLDMLDRESGDMLRKAEHKATLAIAERQIAESCQQQTNSKLLDRENELLALKGEVKSLRLQLSTSEESRKKLIVEAQVNEETMASLQKQVSDMQQSESIHRNAVLHNEIVESIKEKHDKELSLKQQELEDALILLDEQKRCNTRLTDELTEMTDSKQRLAADKAEIINKLTKSLEVAQKQYQNILDSDVGRFHSRLTVEQKKRHEAEDRVSSMQLELDMLKRDLQICESVLGMNNRPAFHRDFNTAPESGMMNAPLDGDHTTLRKDLYKALENARAYREELTKLQRQVGEAKGQGVSDVVVISDLIDASIQVDLMADDSETVSQLCEMRDRVKAVSSDLDDARNLVAILENEKSELLSTVECLRERLSDHIVEADQARIEAVEEVRQSCLRLHDDIVGEIRKEKNERYEKEIQSLKTTVEHLENDITEVKKLYIAVCDENSNLNTALEAIRTKVPQLSSIGSQTEHSSVGARNKTAFANTETQTEPHLATLETNKNLSGTKRPLSSKENQIPFGDGCKNNAAQSVALSSKHSDARKDDSCCSDCTAVSGTGIVESLKSRLNDAVSRLHAASEQSQKEKDEIVALYENQVQELMDQNRLATAAIGSNKLHTEKVTLLESECNRLREELRSAQVQHEKILKQRESEYGQVLASYQNLMKAKAQELKVMEVEIRSKLAGSSGSQRTDSHGLVAHNQQLKQLCENVVAAMQEERENCRKQLELLTTNDETVSTLKKMLAKSRSECDTMTQRVKTAESERDCLLERVRSMRDKIRSYHCQVKQREEHYNSELQRMESEYRDALARVKEHTASKYRRNLANNSKCVQTGISGDELDKKFNEVSIYRAKLQQMKVDLTETLRNCQVPIGEGTICATQYENDCRSTSAKTYEGFSSGFRFTVENPDNANQPAHTLLDGPDSQGIVGASNCRAIVSSSRTGTKSNEALAIEAESLIENPLVSLERIRNDMEFIFSQGSVSSESDNHPESVQIPEKEAAVIGNSHKVRT